MAQALVWQLIRENNSFLVKRGQTKRDGSVQFSTEPGNLLNVNSFKYSGIANNSVIGINSVVSSSDKHKKGVPKVEVTIKVILYLSLKYSIYVCLLLLLS